MDRVLLFDIDGTLLRTEGASSQAMEAALLELFGLREALKEVRLAGNLDPRILREALAPLALEGEALALAVQKALAGYLARLPASLASGRAGHALPGARAILQELAGRDGVHLGILTGNVERGAQLKLGRYGLFGFARFGAYGDDADTRPGLLPVALERAFAQGPAPERYETWVIGDTPADVGVARAHGAFVLAVASGGYDRAALLAAGAEHVLPDMRDTAHVLDLLLGPPP
ncbi:MAG: HAD family hydrolase [Planctomycetota bacterium]